MLCVGGMASGASLLILGILGLYAGYAGKRQRHFVAYGLVATGMLGVSIFGVIRIKTEMNGFVARRTFSRYWDGAPDSSVLRIQEMGECCGFEGYEDRVQEPCTEYVEKLGCWEAIIRPVHARLLKQAFVPCILISALLFTATLLNIGMALVVKEEVKERRLSIAQRQPFDAWHKAVFQ